jgi:hypothetical protein
VIERMALVGLALLVPLLQGRIDARRGDAQHEEMLYLWSGRYVRQLSPGLENVLADIYWLRTVQYFGAQHAFVKEPTFELLEPLVEITTTLDPHFEMAYRYGAIFLAESAPNGAGKPRAAIALLERGVRENPLAWRLQQDLGFFQFFFLHDADEAARVLEHAATVPGAPDWLRSSAADFLANSGDRQTSRTMWRRLYEGAEGPMRENALFNLRRLDALDAMDRHQESVAAFKSKAGRLPVSLDELGPAGLLRAPTVDPAGIPFHLDPKTGQVWFARSSTFWRPR